MEKQALRKDGNMEKQALRQDGNMKMRKLFIDIKKNLSHKY